MQVVGVDGCRGGWIAARYDVEASTLSYRVHWTFAELITAYPDAEAVAIDIPIGLLNCQARACDVVAKRKLGPKWRSVVPAPDPRVIESPTFTEALERSQELCGYGMSTQAFNIYPKINEVAQVMTPMLQERVIEVHPEVCFWALNDHQPVMSKKRKPEGFRDRRTLLLQTLGIPIPNRVDAFKLARPAKPDDILDALVAAWTARPCSEGQFERLPAYPPVDAQGLRMELVTAEPIESNDDSRPPAAAKRAW